MSENHRRRAETEGTAGGDVLEQDPALPPVAVDPEALAAQDRRWTPGKIALWVGIALLGGLSWTMLAVVRGETVNAIWFVFAAVCTYFIGYRFYSKLIEAKLLKPNDRRATPAEYLADGKDFAATDRRVLYGHHFAAIAGAGPPPDSLRTVTSWCRIPIFRRLRWTPKQRTPKTATGHR